MRGKGVVLLCATMLAGCQMWRSAAPPPPVPQDDTLKLGELVITSDFPLPVEHRLLSEIKLLREDVSQTFRMPPSNEPIQVYLFGTEEKYKAFMKAVHPDFPDRRAFFVESTDRRLKVYAHWGDRMAEDLRHEVSHGYMHSLVRNMPLWLDEGLAKNFEVPRGTRGLNWPLVEQLLSALNQGQWQPDLQRLEQLTDPAAMTQLDYAEAWAWVHLMLQTEPQRKEMLQGYLAALRKDGNAAPLSVQIRGLNIAPQRTLIEYLHGLAAARR